MKATYDRQPAFLVRELDRILDEPGRRKNVALVERALPRPPKRGGVILQGRWACQECVDNGTHTEDLQCDTPGCECSQCDYRGASFDGE